MTRTTIITVTDTTAETTMVDQQNCRRLTRGARAKQEYEYHKQ